MLTSKRQPRQSGHSRRPAQKAANPWQRPYPMVQRCFVCSFPKSRAAAVRVGSTENDLVHAWISAQLRMEGGSPDITLTYQNRLLAVGRQDLGGWTDFLNARGTNENQREGTASQRTRRRIRRRLKAIQLA